VNPAKTTEPIKMLSGLWNRVGPKNRVLDWVQIPMRMGDFEGERGDCKVYGFSAVSCAKTDEPIKMLFGMWTGVGPRKHDEWECTLAPPGECDYPSMRRGDAAL